MSATGNSTESASQQQQLRDSQSTTAAQRQPVNNSSSETATQHQPLGDSQSATPAQRQAINSNSETTLDSKQFSSNRWQQTTQQQQSVSNSQLRNNQSAARSQQQPGNSTQLSNNQLTTASSAATSSTRTTTTTLQCKTAMSALRGGVSNGTPTTYNNNWWRPSTTCGKPLRPQRPLHHHAWADRHRWWRRHGDNDNEDDNEEKITTIYNPTHLRVFLFSRISVQPWCVQRHLGTFSDDSLLLQGVPGSQVFYYLKLWYVTWKKDMAMTKIPPTKDLLHKGHIHLILAARARRRQPWP